jgi:hypothetical protein
MFWAAARRGASKPSSSSSTLKGLLQDCIEIQQRRYAGNLPVKSNKYIEDFGARRETIEKEFVWDGTTVRRLLLWGLAVPYGIYRMTVYEFDRTDEFGKKPKRDLWGSRSSA